MRLLSSWRVTTDTSAFNCLPPHARRARISWLHNGRTWLFSCCPQTLHWAVPSGNGPSLIVFLKSIYAPLKTFHLVDAWQANGKIIWCVPLACGCYAKLGTGTRHNQCQGLSWLACAYCGQLVILQVLWLYFWRWLANKGTEGGTHTKPIWTHKNLVVATYI